MKELTKKEKWYLKGYADALQDAMYELTGDNTCTKSYDPISFRDGYIASYAFDLKNGGRRHELSEFSNSEEIETLMLNQACEWVMHELDKGQAEKNIKPRRISRQEKIRSDK